MPPQAPQLTREQFIEELFRIGKTDNIHSGKELQDKLVGGVNKVVDTIRLSYGPSGSNTIVESDLYPFHLATNDGKTIVKDIKLADSVENIGANIAKEVADKSDKESGDGRKTSMILLQAILKEGLKLKEEPMKIKKSLDECLPLILKNIDDQTKEITIKEVGKIAASASENEKLGQTFQEIYEKIGSDGIIELENSGLPETFYDITEGVRLLNCGFTYPYMTNEDKGRKAVYMFPKVLITKQKITNIQELDKIIRALADKGVNELVIFTEDIEMSVSQALAFLHQGVAPNGQTIPTFKTLVIKAPILWKDWIFEDFAKITGATIVNPTEGRTLKSFQYNWLGYCDKIITSKTETVVLGTQNIDDHLQAISELKTDEGKIRIARLKTKTAILKLGANSETELSYVRGKALDGRNASYLALQGGVVTGAGQVYARIGLPDTIGGHILSKALKYPYNQILENCGLTEVTEEVLDPAIVVKNSIINALSVASTILTTKNLITLPKR